MITKANDQESEIDQVLDALGDKMRRNILNLLKGGAMAVGDIAEQLPISRPAVSKHLRILENAGFVTYTPSGTRNIFRLNSRGFDAARIYLDSFWDEALANFRRIAEEEGRQDR